MRKNTSGFTIVELLIVIVIIGILAAITIVAYNGIQGRARDTTRKSDLSQISKALQVYNVDNGNYIEAGSGCGSDNNGNGWYNRTEAPPNKSTSTCLQEKNAITKDLKDPSGCTAVEGTCKRAYMKYTCSVGTFLYASIESSSQTPAQAVAATPSCMAQSTAESFNINYVLKVN